MNPVPLSNPDPTLLLANFLPPEAAASSQERSSSSSIAPSSTDSVSLIAPALTRSIQEAKNCPAQSSPTENSLCKTVVYVGNKPAHEMLDHYIHALSIPNVSVALDPHVKSDEDLLFVRDWKVTLFNGSHLIPCSPKSLELEMTMKALLPPPSEHIVFSMLKEFGLGLNEDKQADAIVSCQFLQIPYKRGKTAIEGGNCKLFIGRDKAQRAIVGMNSLILTYLALDSQKYFEGHTQLVKEMKDAIESPTDESIRAIRNLCILTKNQGKNNYEPHQIKPHFIRPVSETEKKQCQDIARSFQARINLCKQVIAQELEVPLKNIAFVYQNHFHIDLDLLVTPEGDILIHDEIQSSQILKNHISNTSYRKESEMLNRYLEYSTSKQKIVSMINEKNRVILAEIGCNMHLIPGSFSASGEFTLNFMNGIYLHGPTKAYLFTNSGDHIHQKLMNSFEAAVSEVSKSTQVVFLGKSSNFFCDMLTRYKGGLHCLTWSTSSPSD